MRILSRSQFRAICGPLNVFAMTVIEGLPASAFAICESSRSAFCERPGKGSGAAVQTKGLQENFPGAQPERIMQPRVTELAD
jgi:hypothetical protein